ncbi:MAG: hypothetical protein C0609_04770 [Deltaproteobacteria bacterium]|nr:MAG: hypothetical protein C0609_04770 [Deltaproteobacteria bacterium]
MCESNAYVKRGDGEELILAEVARVEPVDGGYKLIGLLGDEMTVHGAIDEINLLNHKILFVESA